MHVLMDIETRSAVDLKVVGSHVYATNPSTQILTAVWYDGVYHLWINSQVPTTNVEQMRKLLSEVHRWWPVDYGEAPPIVGYYSDRPPRIVGTWVAHNGSGFDRIVWEHSGYHQPNGWYDTLPVARAAGLPGALDALGMRFLGKGKNAGSDILKKHMIRGKNKKLGDVIPTMDLFHIGIYNLIDVVLLKRIYRELSDYNIEADIVQTSDDVNNRGILLDVPFARNIQAVAWQSVARSLDSIVTLTNGQLNAENIRSNKQVTQWLLSRGLKLSNLQRATVEKAIQAFEDGEDIPDIDVSNIDPIVINVLRLRLGVLRVTSAKIDKALLGRCSDDRVRGAFVYHSAHTGRFSSRRIQLHNMPRPKKGIDVHKLLELYNQGQLNYDTIKSIIPEHLTVDDALSALVRPMFKAGEGMILSVADLASIETRMLAWMFDESALLNDISNEDSGADPHGVYCQMASTVYGKTVTRADDELRQVGKIIILGSGYGMSSAKFALMCGLYNVDLASSGTSAEACVQAYRSKFRKIVSGWREFDDAFKRCAKYGTSHTVGRCKIRQSGFSVVVTLSSGREMWYRSCRVEQREPMFAPGTLVPTIVFQSPRGYEETTYGGKLVENVVQASSRDVMAGAMVKIEHVMPGIVAHVHDEILHESRLTSGQEALELVLREMSTSPHWADGLPLGAEGYNTVRYLKEPPKGSKKLKAFNGKLK